MATAPACRAEVRIKDITMVEGARSNQLYGVGLVFGLNGTGAKSLATQQMAIDLLRKLEITTKLQRQTQLDNVFKSTSISQVMVTTEIAPFSRKGSRLDVVVSMVDDGTSLEGGTLLMTPLRGADGTVYAVAQGNISIGGFNVRTNAAGGQMNHPTNARIPAGAIVEQEALGEINQGGVIRLLLREADESTAAVILKAVNARFPDSAITVDPGTIQIRIPTKYHRSISDFSSEIGQIKVMPDAPARVVINERTGTVIVGHNVRISSVAIAHGSLVIKPNVAPAPAPGGLTPLTGDPTLSDAVPPAPGNPDRIDEILEALRPRPVQIPGAQGPAALLEVEQTFTVAELARVLNALGVSPRDLIAIFQALKESGAMHAELRSI
ncbi:MAG: flagellar basal body P-ring protein FlgI [Planctomycetes bacterium]|nr:flagellar basal body P-ring protein FlgI [Planctomycetota bacterium]